MRLAHYIGALAMSLTVALASSSAYALECSREDEFAADKSVDHLSSWKDIYSAYKRFKHCDDGAISEGYSDGVAKIMANHWTGLRKARPLIQADPAFELWIIHHLDETDTNDDLVKIDRLSRTACPKGIQEFCEKIHAHMEEAECPRDFPAGVGCQAKINHP